MTDESRMTCTKCRYEYGKIDYRHLIDGQVTVRVKCPNCGEKTCFGVVSSKPVPFVSESESIE